MKVLLIGSDVSYQHVDSDKLISLGVYPYYLFEGPIQQQKSPRNELFIKNLNLSEVQKVVEENKIDSLVCFNDNFLIETAKIRTELNLPGIGYPEILKFKNKVEMNKALRGKIRTIDTLLFSVSTEYEDILKKLGGESYFIKPDSRAGAEDTFVVRNKEDYIRVKKIIVDKYGQGIIQPYIEAELYHCELYVSNGVAFYKSARRYSYPNHKILNGKIIASLPIKDPYIKQELETASVCVQKELCFTNGVMHTEFFWVNGKPIFLETNIRQAGGSINLIHGKTTGTSMEMAMILLENNISLEFQSKEEGLLFTCGYIPRKKGRVLAINMPEMKGKVLFDCRVKKGENLNKPSSASDVAVSYFAEYNFVEDLFDDFYCLENYDIVSYD